MILIHEGFTEFETLLEGLKAWARAHFVLPDSNTIVSKPEQPDQTSYQVKWNSRRLHTYSCWSLKSCKAPNTKDYVFVGATDSTLAFLHDHRREVDDFQSVVLWYHEDTESFVWRKLFNALIYKRPDVLDVSVVVGSMFWETAPWNVQLARKDGLAWADDLEPLFKWQGWSKDDCPHHHNFLSHLARFSRKRGGKVVSATFEILGTEEESERKAFLAALEAAIDTKRALRKDIAVAKYGVCSPDVKVSEGEMNNLEVAARPVCSSRRLGSSCYWGLSYDDRSNNDDFW